jgi:hypothetical protein
MNSDASFSRICHPKRSAERLFVFAVLLASVLYSTLAFAQIVGTGQLNIERRSHTATLLENGKVLIIGGDNQNGVVSQAEIFDPVSRTSTLAATSLTPRTDHTANRLSDGRVLVIGGRDQNTSLDSTESYNPLTSSFVAGPAMMRARSGHTATVLSNGKIFVSGGDLFGSAEIYDPVTQSFSLVTGSLNTPRKFHSAVSLHNGQVMIVGGIDVQNTMLNTAEVFDPASQSFYLPATDMQAARAFATLKLLPDGKVQIIGGDGELSMEVFDPADGIFIAKALLPPNADLLGATLSTQSRAALFSPSISQDALLQGILTAEQLSLLDRADQSITELPSRNEALVAGGLNSTGQILNSAKLVSSSRASVTTDKTDYAPGQIVTISGSGFQPNENVHIYFHEFPAEYPDIFLSAVANQQGSFVVAEFAPQEIDVGRVFTLTAMGQISGFTAQTAFKDNKNLTVTKAGSGAGTVTSTASSVGGGSVNCGASCTSVVVAFGDTDTITLTATPTSGSVFVGWSFSSSGGDGPPSNPSAGCSSAGTTCTFGMNNKKQQVTATFNTAAVTTTAIDAPAITYGANGSVTVTVYAASGMPTGNVTLAVDGGIPVSKALSGGTATFTSTDIAALTSPNAGDHTLSASYAAQGNFAASSATGNLHVDRASSTTTVTFEAGPYTYRATAFTATAVVTGVGGLNQAVAVVYSGDCTNVTSANGCTATATFDGDTNHNGSSDNKSITIERASSTTVVTFENGPYTYRATAFTATAVVTGVGGLNQAVAVVYSGDCTNVTSANGCTATATFDGDTNHNGSSDNKSITIERASSTTVVTFENGPYTYRAAAFTATAVVTGVGGLNQAVAVVYSGDCTNVTSANGCTATATFDGDTNHNGSSDSKSITINKANQVISVTIHAPSSAIFNTTFNVAATGGASGNPVVITTSGVCLGSGYNSATVTMTSGTGTCTVKYNQAGNNNFHAAPEVLQYTTAEKATATVNLIGLGTYVYDGTAKVITATTNPGGLTVNITYTGSLTTSTPPMNVGTYNVVGTISDLNYQGSANDTLVISAWTLHGFYQPVDMSPSAPASIVWNSVKGGSTVPLKFKVFAGSTELKDVSAVKSLSAMFSSCGGGMDVPIDELSATGGTSLRYDMTGGQFIFNWQTPKGANNCYKVTMTTQDGSALSAYFKTK